jgi:hypothetical protein
VENQRARKQKRLHFVYNVDFYTLSLFLCAGEFFSRKKWRRESRPSCSFSVFTTSFRGEKAASDICTINQKKCLEKRKEKPPCVLKRPYWCNAFFERTKVRREAEFRTCFKKIPLAP